MDHNLSSLSREELQKLFLKESVRFKQGMDNGLSFDELKEIKTTLKEITLALQGKDGQGNGG